ncbi:hypothetical protein BCR44DRAFT_254585 [Catenaria anguillulae PL171]|uniref:NodB homology domain-containing protein n=1 Tax=Catenaria anguillulae PL171 TaxID=765915 RepID=A0A1Y2I3C3_9FUNG|nr:hypothetical protein BCR44DRAFT_254585 [Catenaria anguillulae PL171]
MIFLTWQPLAVVLALATWQATHGTAAPADPTPPHFPPTSEWCYLSNCAQPPSELISHAVELDRQMFGGDAAPPVCGDRICNIQRGETCLSCPSDCGGPCRSTQPLVQCVTPGQMGLTFDDGSSPFTTELVRTLNRLEVPASFFVLGVNLQRDPALANATRFAYESGHLIGSHTYTHRSMGDSGIVQFSVRPPPRAPMPFSHLRTELLFTDLSVYSVIGRRPRIVRPPYLEFNAASMAFLETAGYSVVNINLDTFDWRFNQTAEATPQRVLAELQTQWETAKSQPSWIHLQHDTLGYSTAAIREIVSFLRARDVRFVTMDKCLGVDAYRGASPFLFLLLHV